MEKPVTLKYTGRAIGDHVWIGTRCENKAVEGVITGIRFSDSAVPGEILVDYYLVKEARYADNHDIGDYQFNPETVFDTELAAEEYLYKQQKEYIDSINGLLLETCAHCSRTAKRILELGGEDPKKLDERDKCPRCIILEPLSHGETVDSPEGKYEMRYCSYCGSIFKQDLATGKLEFVEQSAKGFC